MDDKDKKLIEESTAPLQDPPKEEVVLDPANPPTPEPLKEEVNQESSEPPPTEPPTEELATDPAIETPYGVPTTAQLNKINRLAKRKLSKEEVFVYPVKFVGDGMIENRYLKLDKSLLEVFKKDANRGVAFLLDHSWTSFGRLAHPYGRTFEASVEPSRKEDETPKDEQWALYGSVYLVRGKSKDGISTDALIKDIEDGTLSDVSIGFGMDKYECSICGSDIWDCSHRPGREYEVNGEKKLCYIIGKPPGFLMELSGVFDGAYASAKILSQDGEDESEYEEVADIKDVEKGTRLFHIFSSRGLFTFAKKEKANVVTPTIDEAKAKEIAGENWQENLFKLASDAKSLRDDLVKDTLEWGVRANGEHFKQDEYELLFKDMDISRIKSFREMWQKQAREAIPVGRKILAPVPTESKEIPNDAFKMKR